MKPHPHGPESNLMADSTPELILHHYNESPYAEKVRAMLGYKALAWQSVITPMVMPKPDLTALTGGYRKIPVLQIGADVYCDTRLIGQVLDRLHPQPSLASQAGTWDEVIAHWVDVNLFGKAVAFTFSQIVDFLDDTFLADRAAMNGWGSMNRDQVKASAPLARQNLATELLWVEHGLQSGATFVNGDQPGNGDFSLYCAVWFARVGRFDMSLYPALAAWLKRMRAFGQGHRSEMTAQAALDVAQQATPAPLDYEPITPDATGLNLGQRVSVQPEAVGKESVTGELVGISPERITVRINSDRCGDVHVHFPRVGYRIRPAKD